jgi:hypothetical protein
MYVFNRFDCSCAIAGLKFTAVKIPQIPVSIVCTVSTAVVSARLVIPVRYGTAIRRTAEMRRLGKFLYHNIVLSLACSQVTRYKNWLSGTARIYTTDLPKSVTTFKYYD